MAVASRLEFPLSKAQYLYFLTKLGKMPQFRSLILNHAIALPKPISYNQIALLLSFSKTSDRISLLVG
ncbi:hypothetical protein ACE1CI_17995 [Aerosakkonemataceae cyanobacterium BLCC-F50]|uniref:MarR family transcriptional regulator n=1 Tax=Floridaenema flaviceps BLCC-F50 TaxID=3153642 RepID=A0ABV4XSW1_9CYAN